MFNRKSNTNEIYRVKIYLFIYFLLKKQNSWSLKRINTKRSVITVFYLQVDHLCR